MNFTISSNKLIQSTVFIPLIILSTLSFAEKAKKIKSPFSFNIDLGAKYDSNVSVDELDSNTAESDHAGTFDMDLSYKNKFSTKTTFNAAYSFSQSYHDTFDVFDIQTHLASTGIVHEFDSMKMGLTVRQASSQLGGEPFLSLQQFSPHMSKYLGKKLFFRTAYTLSSKDLDYRNDKDANADAISTDLYYFVNGVRTYFLFGYKYKNEEANDDIYSYESHKFKLRFVKKFPVFHENAKFSIGWRYEERDYDAVNPIIGNARKDERQQFHAAIELAFTEAFYTKLSYKHSNNSSNLEFVDYFQDVLSMSVGYKY